MYAGVNVCVSHSENICVYETVFVLVCVRLCTHIRTRVCRYAWVCPHMCYVPGNIN